LPAMLLGVGQPSADAQDWQQPHRFRQLAAEGDLDVRQVSLETCQTDSSNSSGQKVLPKPVCIYKWTEDDVVRWLEASDLGHIAGAFRQHRILGDVLLDIGGEDLLEMGIDTFGDRMRAVKALEQLRLEAEQHAPSKGPMNNSCPLDFLFLGASPLVRRVPGAVVAPMEPIDLEAEQQAINRALTDAGRVCRFQFEFANASELTWTALQQACCVVIFSGHTLPNGHWVLETENGEALAFNPSGLFQQNKAIAPTDTSSADFGYQLPAMAAESSVSHPSMRLRLVVLCSCHSSIPAKLFMDAGVPHVVAVDRSSTVLDVSARVFVQSLCHSLLVGNTVRSAFRHAQWVVEHNECLQTSGYRAKAQKEAQKFLLMPEWSSHAAVLFPAQSRGRATDCSVRRPQALFPRMRIDLTVTRQIELWRVLSALRRHRLVQVLGPPGGGKHTLVCMVAQFAWQRQMFLDGIHYVRMHDIKWIAALDWSVHRSLMACNTPPDSSDRQERAESIFPSSRLDTAKVCNNLFSEKRTLLPGQRLLILDGCHGLYQKCRSSFVKWLSQLLEENPSLQIIITAQAPVLMEDLACSSPDGNNSACAPKVPAESVVELGELSEAEAMQLLCLRCHVLPEAGPFLDEYGAQLARLCGYQPLPLCVCARWLITQLPRSDPRRLIEAIEDDARRLDILQPCALVLDSALSALPDVLQHCLCCLARFQGAFSIDAAASLLAVDLSQAEFWLSSLREYHLLDMVTGHWRDQSDGKPATREGSLYRLQAVLRLHLRSRDRSLVAPWSPKAVDKNARLVIAYITRNMQASVYREEFSNVQLALDLAGTSRTFLVLLWAVRENAWVHAWLGAGRRMKLYERALVVLGQTLGADWIGEAKAQFDATSTAATKKVSGIGDNQDCVLPSDVFCDTPAECPVELGRIKSSLHGMLSSSQPYQPEAPWSLQPNSLFADGSNLNPDEAAMCAAGLLPAESGCSLDFDSLALPLASAAHPAVAALVQCLSNPQSMRRWVAICLLELAAATRTSDPERSLRLASCAMARATASGTSVTMTAAPPEPKRTPADLTKQVRELDGEAKLLIVRALVELALSRLVGGHSLTAYRGLRPAMLLGLAVELGEAVGPMSSQHFNTLKLTGLHAIAFERDPGRAEQLHKRCLELKLEKYRSWQQLEVAESLGDCGVLCHVLGDVGRAESMLRTSLSTLRQLLDPRDSRVADAAMDLAKLLTAQGQWEHAEQLCHQAMAIFRKAPRCQVQLLQTTFQLALLHQSQGQPQLALPLLRECVTKMEHHGLVADSMSVVAVSHSLASCLMQLGSDGDSCHQQKLEEALVLLENAQSIHSKTQLSCNSPCSLMLQRSLGRCQLFLQQPDRALPILHQVFGFMTASGDCRIREISEVRFLLGWGHALQGNVSQALYHLDWLFNTDGVAAELKSTDRAAAEGWVKQMRAAMTAVDSHQSGETGENSEQQQQQQQQQQLRQQPLDDNALLSRGCRKEAAPQPELQGFQPKLMIKSSGGHCNDDVDNGYLFLRDFEAGPLPVFERMRYLMSGRIRSSLGLLPTTAANAFAPCSAAITGRGLFPCIGDIIFQLG